MEKKPAKGRIYRGRILIIVNEGNVVFFLKEQALFIQHNLYRAAVISEMKERDQHSVKE